MNYARLTKWGKWHELTEKGTKTTCGLRATKRLELKSSPANEAPFPFHFHPRGLCTDCGRKIDGKIFPLRVRTYRIRPLSAIKEAKKRIKNWRSRQAWRVRQAYRGLSRGGVRNRT